MKERWIVSWDGGATWTHEMNPVNGAKVTFTDSRDLDNGQVFFRRKLNTELLFTKENYQQFLLQERNRNRRCKEIQIRCELFCHLNWQEVWRGKFSTGMGRFRLEHCEFYVKPEPLDKYSCTLERQGKKYNLLTSGMVTAMVPNLPSLEFGTCTTVGASPSPPTGCDEYQPGGPVSGVYVNGWDTATTSQSAPGSSQVNFYWREAVTTECINGNPVPPPGVGWELISDDCTLNGSARYARQPLVSWPFSAPVVGSIQDGVNTPPDDGCQWVFMGMGGIEDPFDPEEVPLPYYVCIDSAADSATEIDTARTLEGCLNVLLQGMDCGIQGVRSDFFGINAPGNAPGYVPGINYVTGLPTQTEGILMVQKSDAIDPDASNPATIGEMTFKELMNALFVMFRVYWDIDRDGYLRIEHWKYWSTPVGLDLTTAEHVLEPLDYEHLTNEIPRIERATWMEALSRDFVGKDIVYSGPCVRPEENEEKEWSPGKITTDISFVLSDPASIGKDGFVMLATIFDGSAYNTIIDAGAITGNFISNAPLSWANLQRDFWTWDRYLPSGNMNGQDVDFDGFLPNVEQSGVGYAACCKYLRLNPRKRVKTTLGAHLGDITAHIESAEFHMKDKRVRMVLRYAY